MKNDEYLKEYNNKWVKDKQFVLLCYYHYQTEMYDRALTDLRSPHDATEAYIVDPYLKSLSYANARKTRELIEDIGLENGFYVVNKYSNGIYSAQNWIDQYLHLYRNGQLDWLKKYINIIEEDNMGDEKINQATDEIKNYQLQRAKEYLHNNDPIDGSEPSLEWCIISDLYRMIKEK